jgi:hypothetical protein
MISLYSNRDDTAQKITSVKRPINMANNIVTNKPYSTREIDLAD